MDHNEIREHLRESVERRDTAKRAIERETKELARLLAIVPEVEGLTMTEASEILGVSRVMCYEMLKNRKAESL